MQCKFCNAEFEDDRRYCPECGKRQDAKKPSDAETAKKSEQKPKEKKSKNNNNMTLIVAIIAGLIIAGLVVALLVVTRNADKPTTETTAPLNEYAQYTGLVVATMGDAELTNDMLQILYMNMIGSFYQDYGSSLSYFGLDLSQPLNLQEYPYQNENEPDIVTWEDYFVELSVERWKNYIATKALADNAGFTLSEERLKEIDAEMENLVELAATNGYASVESMVQYSYGDCCTLETYKEYVILDTTARDYYASIYGVEITDEMLETCFENNKEELEKKGVTKTSGFNGVVRHILIGPEGGTTDAQGAVTYSDAEWAACKKKAKAILDDWKKGEATEDSFVALVSEHTEDTGSITTGGLYEDVHRESNFVDEFKNWAIDPSRKTGDTDLVKTQYGYHIMYFVSGEAEWMYFTRELVQTERMEELDAQIVAFQEENPTEFFRDKIKMQNTYAR